MKESRVDRWNRFLYLTTLILIALFFVAGFLDQARAQSQMVEKFLVTYFASYKEPASSMPGAKTAAMTVITFSNLFDRQCDVSVVWVRQDGGVLCSGY